MARLEQTGNATRNQAPVGGGDDGAGGRQAHASTRAARRPAIDLFIVDTPLQLMCGYEARSRFAVDEPHLLLLQWPESERSWFDRVLAWDAWASVATFPMVRDAATDASHAGRPEPIKTLRQARRRQRLEALLRRYGSVRRLFVGNYRNAYMRHCAHTLGIEQPVLLDDGTDTLLLARELEAERARARSPAASRGGWLTQMRGRLRSGLADWHCAPHPSVTYFTSYAIAAGPSDVVIGHRFEQLRKRVASATAGEEVLFLGQPLVQDGYLSLDTYREYMRAIRRRYANRRVAYIAHPRESRELAGTAADALGAELRDLRMPIEIWLAEQTVHPAAIVSFFCSALANIAQLVGPAIRLEATRIRSEHLIAARANVEDIYAHFDREWSGVIHIVDP